MAPPAWPAESPTGKTQTMAALHEATTVDGLRAALIIGNGEQAAVNARLECAIKEVAATVTGVASKMETLDKAVRASLQRTELAVGEAKRDVTRTTAARDADLNDRVTKLEDNVRSEGRLRDEAAIGVGEALVAVANENTQTRRVMLTADDLEKRLAMARVAGEAVGKREGLAVGAKRRTWTFRGLLVAALPALVGLIQIISWALRHLFP